MMATFSHGLNTRLFLGGFDVSRFFKSASIDASKDTHETTAFQSTSKTYIPGLKDATASIEGMFDGADQAVDEVLDDIFAQSAYSHFSQYSEGDDLGKFGKGMLAIETAHAVSSSTDDVVQTSAEVQSSSGAERLQSILPGGPVGTADGPAVDAGAASTTGAVGYLHVVGVATSVAVTVQHSVDDVTWVDLITFAVASGAGSQRLTVPGTVNRYLRAKTTTVGGDANIQVGVGRQLPTLP